MISNRLAYTAVFAHLALLCVETTYLCSTLVQNKYMVSEGLKSDLAYHILLTVSMLSSIAACGFFFFTVITEKEGARRAGCVLTTTAAVCWIVLVSDFEEIVHTTASVLFVACAVAYTALMTVVGEPLDIVFTRVYRSLMLVAVLCAAAFMALWADTTAYTEAWGPQHVALVCFAFAQAVFFLGQLISSAVVYRLPGEAYI